MSQLTEKNIIQGLRIYLDLYDNGNISRRDFEQMLTDHILALIEIAKETNF